MAIAALTLAVEAESLFGAVAFEAAELAASIANKIPYIAGTGLGIYGLSKIKLGEKPRFASRSNLGRLANKTEAQTKFTTPKRPRLSEPPSISARRTRSYTAANPEGWQPTSAGALWYANGKRRGLTQKRKWRSRYRGFAK